MIPSFFCIKAVRMSFPIYISTLKSLLSNRGLDDSPKPTLHWIPGHYTASGEDKKHPRISGRKSRSLIFVDMKLRNRIMIPRKNRRGLSRHPAPSTKHTSSTLSAVLKCNYC